MQESSPSSPERYRYILNLTERVAHRERGLTEKCNTDAIVKRRTSLVLPQSYRKCEHCFS